MPEWSFEIVTSIDRVTESDWNALCGGRAFVDHRWLRMVESVLANYEPRYVLLRRDGHLEGAAVCALDRRFSTQPSNTELAGCSVSCHICGAVSRSCSKRA